MLSIAQITPSFFPFIGGIESYVFEISKELVARGHEVHVFAPEKVMNTKCGDKEEKICGIRIHRLPVWFELTYRAKWWPIFRKIVDSGFRFDIVNIQCHDHPHSLIATTAAKTRNMPVAITTYGPIATQSDYSNITTFFLNAYDHFVSRAIFRMADRVLIKFPTLRKWIKSHGISEEKISVAPSGIPKECLLPRTGESFRQNFDGKKVILYVGRISPQKGVQYLVEAMPKVINEVPEAILTIIGPDYIGFKKSLIRQVHRLRIDEKVVFMNPIFNLEREMEAYAGCDVFVMPSSFEGFSQSVHKAWTQKKRVVARDVGFLSTQIESWQNGILVEYGNAQAIADSIASILENSKMSRKMGMKGYRKAQNYTFDVLAKSLEKIFFSMGVEKA